ATKKILRGGERLFAIRALSRFDLDDSVHEYKGLAVGKAEFYRIHALTMKGAAAPDNAKVRVFLFRSF
ncbi:MAG: hypothetical protein ABIP97_08085, partial [Chthoniobacterales bacterium]